jgi:hypothetical protein
MPRFRISASAAIAVALIVIGSGLRVAWTVEHPPTDYVYSDPARHWFDATHPLETNPLTGIDPPAYDIWLGMIAHLTVGDRLAMGIYAAVLSLTAPFAWFLFARSVLRHPTLALWFWATLVWLPSWVGVFSYFMNETLLIPLIGLSLWQSVREDVDSGKRWVVLNLTWAVTCLTRLIALPLACVAIGFALSGTRRMLRRALLAALVWACVLTPAAYRAKQIINIATPFGLPYPHHIYWESGMRDIYLHLSRPSRAATFNYHFAANSVFNEPLRPFSHYQVRPSGQVDVFVNLDKGSEDWRAAAELYAPTFSARMHLYGENALLFLLGDSWPDGHREFFWENVAYHFHWGWAFIVLGSVIGSVVYVCRTRSVQLMPALTITALLVPLLSNAGLMEARFRKPLEGIFILALFWLAERYVNRAENIEAQTPGTEAKAIQALP